MNFKQTQEMTSLQGNKNKLINLFYLVAGVVLIFIAVNVFNGLKPLVDESFTSHNVETSHPDSLLNHANTYYWWGRYRKNTLPEFDTAASWAGKSLQLAEIRFQKDHDTLAFQQRKRQAENLITLAKQQADICRYNIGSHIPLYMEIMGYDDDYMHEDADVEDVPQVALRDALDRLTGLVSPDRNQPVSSRTSFALVNVNTSNPKAEEMLVQELNNKTRMYTIAPHELARIAGKDSIRVADAIMDTALMKKIATAFNTDELAVIDFIENDKVNGVYYYGMRLKLWTIDKGWNSRNTYTEYMVRNRVFNQVTMFIGQLILVILLFSLAINFIVIPISSWLVNMKTITPYYFLLCCIIAMITQYLLVTFGLKNFLNPTPDAYFVSDMGEQWAFAYPLTFIVPVFITYLVLGKMDNFISSFRSDFENPLAIFALVAGSLMPVAFSFTYYNIIRFGFGESAYAIFTIILMILFFALAISRYWSAIVNFPQKIHIAIRCITWVGIVIHFYIAFSFVGSLLQSYDNNSIDDWFFYSFLIPMGAIEFVRYLIVVIVNRVSRKKIGQLQSGSIPEDIERLKINADELIVELTTPQEAASSGTVYHYASLYVKTQRGTPTRSSVEFNLLRHLDNIDYLVIDFVNNTTAKEDVHYLPFAKAFEERISYNKFNDIAETARKTSNIIGKALSAITSAAGFLIDDGKTKARNPDEIAGLLLSKISRKKTILLFDHIEKIDEENIQLLEAFVKQLIKQRLERDAAKKNKQIPLLIVCGTGEFGYRDKVISILEKLQRDSLKGGVFEFEMRFEKVVDNFLSLQCLPVQEEIHLKELYVKEQRDYAPDVVRETFEALIKNNLIKKHQVAGEDLLLLSLPDLQQLPDSRIGQDLDEAVHNHAALKEVLIAAAYLADENARFYLPVLSYALRKDRIQILHLLKEAEYFNLVYDLKGQKNFYWYAFTDRGLVADFKELENPRQEQVSQLANEYYRGFVEYYCQEQDIAKNMNHLNEMILSGKISVVNLLLLAQRSYKVMPAFPGLSFAIHHLTAGYLGFNGVARFNEALITTDKAIEVYEGLHEVEKEQFRKHYFELRQLKFQLLIETGKYKTESIDSLYDSLTADVFFPTKHDRDWIVFMCWVIRLCFTRFNSSDQEKGTELCHEILNIPQLDEFTRLRVLFYQLKLVPSHLLLFGKNTFNPSKVIEVSNQYARLINKLESTLHDQNSIPAKEIYRELLNDYAGSFLTDKILSVFDTLNNPAQEELQPLFDSLEVRTSSDLFSVIRLLLAKRIQVELGDGSIITDSNEVISAFDGKNLNYLLHNNEVAIDKRGLCYTLNYYARACRTVGKEDEVFKYAGLSYEFNMQVGDKIGACIAAGTAGFAAAGLGNQEDAYNWFRTSFGIGWSIKHLSMFNMVMHMQMMAKSIYDDRKEKEVRFYARQLELLSVIPFMERKTMTEDLALELLSNKQELEIIAERKRLIEPYYQLGKNPIDFISSLHEVVEKNEFNDDQFIVTSSPDSKVLSAFIQSKLVTIQYKGIEEMLIIYASCIKDTSEWFISHVEFKKP